MVGFIMTNGQMGVSCFERNAIFVSNYACNSFCSYGFLIPRRPIFPTGLNVTKNEKIHVHGVIGVKIQNSRTISALLKGESDNRFVRGDILEKEVEFKPSFDEYLKTMESVRVSRDKKQANNSKKQRMNDNPVEKVIFRTPPMERGEENVKLKEFEGVLDQEKVLKVVEEEGLPKNALGIIGKESQLRGKLSYKGQVSTEFMDGIDAEEGNVNTKINKKPGREITKGIFLKHQTSSTEFMDGIDAEEGNVNTKINKKPGREITKGIFLKHQTSSMEQESEYSNLYRSTKAYNAQGSSRALAPVQSKRHSSHVEGKHVYDAGSLGMLRKKGTGISQRDHTSFRKTFNEKKIGVGRDKELHGGLERKYIQVEEVTTNEFVHNNGKSTRSRKTFSERADDYGSKVERAAFKTFDEFNDIMDKPRVSRVEMEDRIQKLAYRSALYLIFFLVFQIMNKLSHLTLLCHYNW
jgi:hypothetical protein